MTIKTAVSLFSGCGGSDLGLHAAGFEVRMANDVWLAASLTYQHNLPETDFRHTSVTKLEKFPRAQLLVGCYPCQGFSQGGARDSGRKINFLYREFDRALRSIRPRAFVVENVSGMSRSNFQHLLNNQLTRYRLAGYRVSWKVLNAADYGVPQERKRLFIVGIRSNFGISYDFPKPSHGPKASKLHITQADAIAGMSMWPKGEFWDQKFHWYYMSRDRRKPWDAPSNTIVSNPRHMPLHPYSPKLIKVGADKWVFESNGPRRRLSYREALLLQGFPRDFELPDDISLKQKYEVIGNAVPPKLFKAVVKAIPDIWR